MVSPAASSPGRVSAHSSQPGRARLGRGGRGNSASRTDVIVVGAGPVGLMLAGELRLGGAEVVVLEPQRRPPRESMEVTLNSGTMEIFSSRGLLPSIGRLRGETQGHFGGIPLDLTLRGPFAGQWTVPQARVEAALERWAVTLGARVRCGCRVRRLTGRDDHVEVEAAGPRGGTLRLRARYVVGCDGAQSGVRQLAGFELAGQRGWRELLRADICGSVLPDQCLRRPPGGLAIASSQRAGVTRVTVHVFGDASRGTAGAVPGDGSRLVKNYRQGRILVAGDAAHVQTPVGGQALNLGLQDAVNLGWKLAAQVAGWAPQGLLDTYHAERHPVAQQTQASIAAQALLLPGDPEAEPLRAVFARLVRMEQIRAQLAGVITGLGVRYEVGPGSYPLLGARIPPVAVDATGPVTTTSLLCAARGVLLDPSGCTRRQERVLREARRWADRVDLVPASILRGGRQLPSTDAVLLRPDGHIVWAGPGPAGLTEALHRWFGAPALL
jgi:2-polyprenyl-6-methoxyphenol hydroxylase-like FAD-dependent oxidoreductase